ncbi:MAG: hypothetical protein M1834_001107 [Cirrosporium novae-zelandiae]|nr:MAG: hypothetical protein M1834_001107 [Cirrosporium novae-zelandiae]
MAFSVPSTRGNAKVCLYRGYKNRNARLDALDKSPPKYLAESSVALANQTFEDLESEPELNEIQSYLNLKYVLLGRVIRARKLHHAHFFSSNNDYGHHHYLDNLENQRFIVLRAIERLVRRTADMLYKKQKWFEWVRQCQDDEETHRENEKKKVKREAALFKRYMKETQARMAQSKTKEALKRDEKYLDEVYKKRMSRLPRLSQEEEEAEWDPIEDVEEGERANYVELIKLFLMMPEERLEKEGSEKDNGVEEEKEKIMKENTPLNGSGGKGNEPAKSSKASKNAKKKAKKNGTKTIETPEQIRKRLREGVKYAHGEGLMVRGTIEHPIELYYRAAPLPDDEINNLLLDIAEIKKLLFCRLLLSHVTLLPIALRANSVEEFLNDKDVTNADLRDLCLRMEKPELQEVRDACADLTRGDEEGEEDDEREEDDDNETDKRLGKKPAYFWESRNRKGALPEKWTSKRESQTQNRRKMQEMFSQDAMIDFGEVDDEGEFRVKKMRVKICGKSIYNYPSEKSISRGGWLQFCIIAKDCNLFDAVQLCRNWDEFFELKILAIYQFFPAANWLEWAGDRYKTQLLELGFIPYFQFDEAEKVTSRHQTGRRGPGRRMHAVIESRNFVCAYIKRNDLIGRIIVLPREEEFWLVCEKSGAGRAAKNEWNVRSKVGPEFFEQMEKFRRWHLGFNSHYDVYIWDKDPGSPFSDLYSNISEALIKANRFVDMKEFYNVAAPILKTLTRESSNHRVREIKPGEEARSIYDVFHSEDTTTRVWNDKGEILESPKYWFYAEADALEDAVLFPEEQLGDKSALFKKNSNALLDFESHGPSINRFVQGIEYSSDEADEGSSDYGDFSDEEFDEEDGEDYEDYTDESGDEDLEPINEEEEEDVDAVFNVFMDREKARVFKKCWHESGLEPDADAKYREAKKMITEMGYFNIEFNGVFRIFDMYEWFHMVSAEIKRGGRDMKRAMDSISLFYPSKFFENERGEKFKDSLLVKQEERAKQLPDRRSDLSNKTRPKSFWEEWDSIRKEGSLQKNYPAEWDIAI